LDKQPARVKPKAESLLNQEAEVEDDDLFDTALQDQRFDSMKEFLPELLGLYRDNVVSTLYRVRECLAAGDTQGAGKAAHNLKGMSAVVCARAVQELAVELELAVQKNDMDCLPSLLARLEGRVEKTVAYLNATLPGPA
jgi:HPt (histidine-containing phosphotransfer) domain-containing protein